MSEQFYDLFVTNQDGCVFFLKRFKKKLNLLQAKVRLNSLGIKTNVTIRYEEY